MIDDVFSTVILVRPCRAPADAQYPILELEMAKDAWRALDRRSGETLHVMISPKDLLLLR